MNWLTLAKSSLVALPLLMGLASCETMSNILDTGRKTDLDQVDKLLGQVERVHVECEFTKQHVHTTLASLHAMVKPDFQGKAQDAYEEFLEAIERSEDQAKELDKAIAPMEKVAEKAFAQWTEDLEQFTSASMRAHSQARLEETRARYDDVLTTLEPTLAALDAFNAELQDHALYLGNDFNAASIAVIEDELRALALHGAELDAGFAACLATTRTFIEKSALHGQVVAQDD